MVLMVPMLGSGCYRIGAVFGRDSGADSDADPSGDGGGSIPASTCGNGIVERAANPPEYCDDGNLNDADLCRNTCTRSCAPPAAPVCDENADDCTSGSCDVGRDAECVAVRAPIGTPCTTGAGCIGGVCTLPEYVPPPPPTSTCGNGIVERAVDPPEYCDDGNTNDADLCSSTCTRSCLPPATPSCNENDDDCTSGVCNQMGTTFCEVVREPAGTPCTTGTLCVGGFCTLPD